MQEEELKGNCPVLNERLSHIFNRFKADPSGLFLHLNRWKKDQIEKLLDSLKQLSVTYRSDSLRSNLFLTWEQIVDMRDIADFGSHTCSHVSLSTIGSQELAHEIEDSKKKIQDRLGEKIISFSYPAGHYTEGLKSAVAKSGYSFAVTQDKGINDLHDK